MRRRAVLHVISSTDRRGAEVFAVDLHEALLARGRRSQVVALAPGDASRPLDVAVLAGRRFGGLRRLRRLAASFDVVVAHGSSALPACAIGLFGGPTPFVYRNIGAPSYWAGSPLRRLRVVLFLRRAERVAALWPGSAEILTASFRVDPRKVVVIPNARPAGRFPEVTVERRAAARASLDLAPESLVLAYVGSLTTEKGVDVLLDAMAALDPGVTLVLAGDGADRESLQRRGATIGPRVRFVGPTADPAGVIAAADVVVLPSRSEGLPAVAIEAGLSGVAVVATDVGGTSEIVVDGETGVLVEPGDPGALARGIHRAIETRSELGRAAHARCLGRFELEVVADAWEVLLDGVSAGG